MRSFKQIDEFTLEECKQYLDGKNVSSPYYSEVSERLNTLQAEQNAKDDSHYAECDTVADFNEYLRLFPQGLHEQDAKEQIRKLNAQNKQLNEQRKKDIKRKIFIVVSFILAVVCVVCWLNYHPVDNLTIESPKEISKYGETVSLDVHTNSKHIESYSDSDWIKAEILSSGKLQITVVPNANERKSGHVTVKAYSRLFDWNVASEDIVITITQASGIASYMTVNRSSISYNKWGRSNNGNSFVIETDGVEREIKSNKEWIKIVPQKGKNKNKITYKVEIEKNEESDRDGLINISSVPADPRFYREIRVTQESGLASELSVGQSRVEFDDNENSAFYIPITTDGTSWKAVGSDKWIKTTAETNEGRLKIVIEDNTDKVREGSVTVYSNKGHSQRINIWQNGDPSNFDTSFNFWRPGVGRSSESVTVYNDSRHPIYASGDKNWLSTRVSGNKVTIYCESNNEEPRLGTVKITCGNKTCDVDVKQDGYIKCRPCLGKGTIPCDNFTGERGRDAFGNQYHKVLNPDMSQFYTNRRFLDCSRCNGTGFMTCNECNRKGKVIAGY